MLIGTPITIRLVKDMFSSVSFASIVSFADLDRDITWQIYSDSHSCMREMHSFFCLQKLMCYLIDH